MTPFYETIENFKGMWNVTVEIESFDPGSRSGIPWDAGELIFVIADVDTGLKMEDAEQWDSEDNAIPIDWRETYAAELSQYLWGVMGC